MIGPIEENERLEPTIPLPEVPVYQAIHTIIQISFTQGIMYSNQSHLIFMSVLDGFTQEEIVETIPYFVEAGLLYIHDDEESYMLNVYCRNLVSMTELSQMTHIQTVNNMMKETGVTNTYHRILVAPFRFDEQTGRFLIPLQRR